MRNCGTLWMGQVIEQEIASESRNFEYWHPEGNSGSWKNTRPATEMIRQCATAHEASTMWMGGDDDKEAPIGLDYRSKGVENVHYWRIPIPNCTIVESNWCNGGFGYVPSRNP